LDGHNIPALVKALDVAKKIDAPVLIHAFTKKGKGHAPAERNPDDYHGIGCFDPNDADAPAKSGD
jgi:1-deoxy-D-xylulose-5-phosphate synthase